MVRKTFSSEVRMNYNRYNYLFFELLVFRVDSVKYFASKIHKKTLIDYKELTLTELNRPVCQEILASQSTVASQFHKSDTTSFTGK